MFSSCVLLYLAASGYVSSSASWFHLISHHHLSGLFSLSSLNRTVVSLWESQPVWPLLWRQVGSGRCQTPSLLRIDQTRGGGRRHHHYVVLSLLLILLCHAAFHHAVVEWPGQCATLYWQSDRPMSRRADTEREREWKWRNKSTQAGKKHRYSKQNLPDIIEIQVISLCYYYFFWIFSCFFKTWY